MDNIKSDINRHNIAVANEIRKQGFRSLIDAQPKIKENVFALYKYGYTATKIHQVLISEQTEDDIIPSRQQISAYCKRRFTPPKVIYNIDPRTPAFNKMMSEFQPFRKTLEEMDILQQMTTLAFDQDDPKQAMRLITARARLANAFFNRLETSHHLYKFRADNYAFLNSIMNPEIESDYHLNYGNRR